MAHEPLNAGALTEESQIISYLPLVRALARRECIRRGGQMEYDDLYQYGCIGLIKAVRSFASPDVDAFRVYAHGRITSQMIDAFRKEHHLKARIRRGIFMEQFTPAIVHVKTGETPEALNRSLDITAALRRLDTREARIMRDYLAGYTGAELAVSERLSEGRISQIIKDGLAKVRQGPAPTQ